MLSNLLSRFINSSTSPENDKYRALFESIENCVTDATSYIYSHSRLPFNDCEGYQELKKLAADDKIEALLSLVRRTNHFQKKQSDYRHPDHTKYNIDTSLLDALMRTRIDFPETFSFFELFSLFYYQDTLLKKNIRLHDRPFGGLVTQIEKHVNRHGLQASTKQDIEKILKQPALSDYLDGNASSSYWGPDILKAVKKLQNLLHSEDEEGNSTVPPYQFGIGRFGSLVQADLQAMKDEEQGKWNALFHHLSTASTGKPSRKFLTIAKPLLDDIGTSTFKTHANRWFSQLAQLDVIITTHTSTYNGREYTYNTYEYIEPQNQNLLKGLLWSMSRFHDQDSLATIAKLVEKCFQKIPGQGPAAAGVGNAGIYTLAESRGLVGISHLSRLKLRIRQNNTQKLIQKYIDEQASKLGIKPAQVEELSAADYGLVNGSRVDAFEDYQLQLNLTDIGNTVLQWLKPDGTPQKSVPAFVKSSDKLSARLKKIRDLSKQIKTASTTQRDRIDRLYTENMQWTVADFNQYYLHHGLVGQIARKLVWNLDQQPAIYHNEHWENHRGEPVNVSDDTVIRLWHPIDSDADTVLAWRDRLEQLNIRQPLKQAYREIYILTDAELNTRIYSNRMAAHIIKQHQFNSLAALRGWKYSLLGAYDDGRDGEVATKSLPEYNLTAQFWINEIIDDTDSFNDAGIWLYVATDQVRFCDDAGEPVPLVDVPPLVLSEIMRDVDLFVGVASVGNDPQWQDGGPDARPDYRAYWQSYSFGDLTEVARTRKSVLERLLPRLKIRDVASIDGKFLIVKGKKHTYKIHIGSGNILIAPHDRYLCIVPGRGKDRNVDQVFLPFEGDNGLSIVLSKAFLLADDDRITDPTILSQL